MNKKYDVTAIGNAIVDVLSFCDDAYLKQHGLVKGSMRLIDGDEAERLYNSTGSSRECSGGSAANTAAGIAALGGKAAFIGKVGKDQLGEIFAHDLAGTGVDFLLGSHSPDKRTAVSLILVTGDGERTMNTCLGAAPEFGDDDINEEAIAAAQILYIEGYLWDMETTKQALRKALTIAKQYEIKVAFTLSDVFCVQRHYNDFHELINNHVDILFANEAELLVLYQGVALADALEKVKSQCQLAIVTRSEKGCVVVTPDKIIEEPGRHVDNIVDATGAGDLFAAGFLYGLTHGYTLEACARLGNMAASKVIQQLGARLLKPLEISLKAAHG